jgi:hypothetical protein
MTETPGNDQPLKKCTPRVRRKETPVRSATDTRQICSQLSAGDGAAIVVADFQGFDGLPRLSRLLYDAAVGQRIYQVDPLAALSGDRIYAALPELADETVAIFRSCESSEVPEQRVFIVSQCSTAGLSLQIANRLIGTRNVTAILVQPTWPSTEDIAEQFAEFQGKLGLGTRLSPDLDGDPWSCIAGMERFMREGLAGLAARLGLGAPPPAFAELLVSYRTWLAFLLACRNDLPAKAPFDALTVAVLTDEPDFVLPGTGPGRCRITPLPPSERPGAVTPDLAKFVLDQVMS